MGSKQEMVIEEAICIHHQPSVWSVRTHGFFEKERESYILSSCGSHHLSLLPFAWQQRLSLIGWWVWKGTLTGDSCGIKVCIQKRQEGFELLLSSVNKTPLMTEKSSNISSSTEWMMICCLAQKVTGREDCINKRTHHPRWTFVL